MTRRQLAAAASRPRSRRGMVGPVLASGVVAACLAATAAPAASASSARARSSHPCPGPETLVSNTSWTTHRLAPGVVLKEGVHDDRTVFGSPGAVDMHVLRINLANRAVQTAPLVDHLAERQPLSVLADGHSRLVAATNTGFFDFYFGAPGGPVVSGGRPLLMAARHQPVVGFTTRGRAEAASVWLVGTVRVGGRTRAVQSVNDLSPARGLSIYTPLWGQINHVPTPGGRGTVLRLVRGGAVAGPAMHGDHLAPSRGELLVASTRASESWLQSLPNHTRVKTSLHVASTARRPLLSGYNVGVQLVRRGVMARGLGCNERDTQAARTGIGIANDGKTLIIAVVADHPCWSRRSQGCGPRQVHGLDHKEMAHLMVELGARTAYQWDGSGSSELIARMPSTHKLEIRNYCADGEERPMPVGFGIFHRATRR